MAVAAFFCFFGWGEHDAWVVSSQVFDVAGGLAEMLHFDSTPEILVLANTTTVTTVPAATRTPYLMTTNTWLPSLVQDHASYMSAAAFTI